jgi:hypothetical protein
MISVVAYIYRTRHKPCGIPPATMGPNPEHSHNGQHSPTHLSWNVFHVHYHRNLSVHFFVEVLFDPTIRQHNSQVLPLQQFCFLLASSDFVWDSLKIVYTCLSTMLSAIPTRQSDPILGLTIDEQCIFSQASKQLCLTKFMIAGEQIQRSSYPSPSRWTGILSILTPLESMVGLYCHTIVK